MEFKIISLTHDELVYLFSTATYGSDWLKITVAQDCGAIVPPIIETIEKNFNGTYCREDRWADILLNGGTIVALDYYDEDEDGEEGKEYPITLEMLLNGLSIAQKKCPYNFNNVISFDGSDDYYDANNVMQCVIFGEVVYG